MSESVLRVWSRTKPLIYFGGASLGRLGHWSLGVKKVQQTSVYRNNNNTSYNYTAPYFKLF